MPSVADAAQFRTLLKRPRRRVADTGACGEKHSAAALAAGLTLPQRLAKMNTFDCFLSKMIVISRSM